MAKRGEAAPRAEGLSPLAAALGAGDVFDGEDMLREACEGAWGGRREGGSEGRRKKSVVQPCEVPESGEGMWQVYCLRKTSLVGCEQELNGTVRRLERKFCSV